MTKGTTVHWRGKTRTTVIREQRAKSRSVTF